MVSLDMEGFVFHIIFCFYFSMTYYVSMNGSKKPLSKTLFWYIG